MSRNNIIYAMREEKIVHISEVESGLKCKCNCTACGQALVAKKGKKMVHHFAHNSLEECKYGYQTSLHLAAKRIISENMKISVPKLQLTIDRIKNIDINDERYIKVHKVILEKMVDNIIPDILLETEIGKIIVEIYVTHKIDDKKLDRIKKIGISTIEIDLSKIDRNITDKELEEILLNDTTYKSWIYNKEINEVYEKFISNSDYRKAVQRGFASHIDDCPIKMREWNGKYYANLVRDCFQCQYLMSYNQEDKNDSGTILCSGRTRISEVKDLEISLEERIKKFDDKKEEELYELVGQGICPQCGNDLIIRNGKYGEFFGCSNFPYCNFTIQY